MQNGDIHLYLNGVPLDWSILYFFCDGSPSTGEGGETGGHSFMNSLLSAMLLSAMTHHVGCLATPPRFGHRYGLAKWYGRDLIGG